MKYKVPVFITQEAFVIVAASSWEEAATLAEEKIDSDTFNPKKDIKEVEYLHILVDHDSIELNKGE